MKYITRLITVIHWNDIYCTYPYSDHRHFCLGYFWRWNSDKSAWYFGATVWLKEVFTRAALRVSVLFCPRRSMFNDSLVVYNTSLDNSDIKKSNWNVKCERKYRGEKDRMSKIAFIVFPNSM